MGNFSNKLKDFLWSFKQNKKAQTILLVILIVILLVVAGYFIYRLTVNTEGKDETSSVNTSIFLSGTHRRDIDGVYVGADRVSPYPVGVMIENLVTVRPQSGLSSANIVYEALAEGGITRFLVIYADSGSISEIGPVRSARPYFLDWAAEYGSLYAHAGGSPQALAAISGLNIISINQIGGAHAYYWRDITKSAPHNLYTSSELLARALRDYDLEKDSSFSGWEFKDDASLSERPSEDKFVRIDFSTYSYEVEWNYDRESNSYLRSNGGEAQIDKNNDKQVSAKNVIVQKTDTGILDNEARLDIKTDGEGDAIVFQDGQAVTGTWKKDNNRTRFYDVNDEEIELNAGQTWIEVVPTDRQVEYN